ncbi:hypothetical protein TL16_g03688 [Triparma laevis f. inornata]|uniref:PCI domain-containing protein n=2 Tax=Triparma laevis TaxID=1534972 RepID=A0A9W7FJS2_9STRA|nr:hypothetical protein TL16_g03688 [Triparma laevis f. inornata]GMI13792.1 hypothetical protein TrLO_g920 [Triparma laevis f. longispina]
MEVAEEMKVDSETPIDVSDFDLTTLKSYTGPTLLTRLSFIASNSKVPLSLRAQSLSLLRTSLKNTLNVEMYKKTFTEYENKVMELTGENPDTEWITSTTTTATSNLTHLTSTLEHSKTTLQKPMILQSYRSLAGFYLNSGGYVDALKCYLRSRDVLGGVKEISQMCLDVVGVSCELQNFQHVTSYCTKAEHTSEFKADALTSGKINVCKGLALLHNKNYHSAGQVFTSLPPPFSYPTQIISSDIALYASILSLATLTRTEILNLLSSSTFKTYLEGSPKITTLLESYTQCDYSTCLKVLDTLEPLMHLDIHLNPHVSSLRKKILSSCITNFFKPYKSVTLKRIGEICNLDEGGVGKVLKELIEEGGVVGRIDLMEGVLEEIEIFPEIEAAENVSKLASEFLETSEATLLRISMVEEGLVNSQGGGKVRGRRKGRRGMGGLDDEEEEWGEGGLDDMDLDVFVEQKI